MRKLLCIDPDSSSISVTDITQTSVRVSWSTGQTQVVNSIVVHYRATGATSWNTRSASQTTTHVTVSALQPGTQYEFYVKISSYGKSSTSNTVTVTTGKWCYYVHVGLQALISMMPKPKSPDEYSSDNVSTTVVSVTVSLVQLYTNEHLVLIGYRPAKRGVF